MISRFRTKIVRYSEKDFNKKKIISHMELYSSSIFKGYVLCSIYETNNNDLRLICLTVLIYRLELTVYVRIKRKK